MRFLLDQDVYEVTARFLVAVGHEVLKAAEAGLAKADDVDLLKEAHSQHRLFVTRDKDFGSLVFVGQQSSGILFLRILPSTVTAVHNELERVLAKYSEAELSQSFVVVEAGRHRIRKRP